MSQANNQVLFGKLVNGGHISKFGNFSKFATLKNSNLFYGFPYKSVLFFLNTLQEDERWKMSRSNVIVSIAKLIPLFQPFLNYLESQSRILRLIGLAARLKEWSESTQITRCTSKPNTIEEKENL